MAAQLEDEVLGMSAQMMPHEAVLDVGSGDVSEEAWELAGVIANLGHNALLAGGEAVRLLSQILPSSGERNELLIEVAEILLGQYLDHHGSSPTIRTAVSEQLLPALQSLRGCLRSHRAFHRATSLSPVLKTGCVLAAQVTVAASFSLEGISETEFTESAEELATLLQEAVVSRAERFLPVDSKRIMAAHRTFVERQAKITTAMRERGGVEPVAPAPVDPEHEPRKWKSEALRMFWEHRAIPHAVQGKGANRGLVSLDAAAILLLQATFADQNHENRERVMAALQRCCGAGTLPGMMSPDSLDEAVGKDIESAGGLRNWVYGTVLGIPPLPEHGEEKLHKTMGGIGMPTSVLASTGTTTAPATEDGQASSLGGTADPAFFASSQLGSSLGGTALIRTTGSSGGFSPEERRALHMGGPAADLGLAAKAFDILDVVEADDLGRTQEILKADMAAPTRHHDTFGDTGLHLAAPRDYGPSVAGRLVGGAPMTSALLERGADPNAQDHVQAGPLHAACAAGNFDAVQALLAKGAEVKLEDRWRQTPLHKAAYAGQTKVASLLLADKARAQGTLDLPDAWGATPLHMAAAQGHFEMLRLLLKHGARLNAEDQLGQTPLYHAAKHGFYDLAKELLQAGAPADRADKAGRTARDAARSRGHTDLITLLRFYSREQQQQQNQTQNNSAPGQQERTTWLMRGDLSAY